MLRASDAMKAIVGSYLEIQAQLASDKTEGIKASATALATRADGPGRRRRADREVGQGRRRGAGSQGGARSVRPLSDAVIAPRRPKAGRIGGVRLAYCPMVKQSWLQKDEKIKNPYYGTTMLDVRRDQEVRVGTGQRHCLRPHADSVSVHQTLANGLDVIVHEDRDCPIVAVNVWYHVGSKNEQPGRTGFAHLFEHLMFEGSQHYDQGFFRPLQEAGGVLNGSTNADRTNYWEVVPSSALELALWMESDRMGYLLPALTEAKFENQRNVVLNERRQNYENRPYGLAGMALVAALYPPDHPYHWMTIGARRRSEGGRAWRRQEFFQTYYRPRNASLALAGDITPSARSRWRTSTSASSSQRPEPPPVECAAPRY